MHFETRAYAPSITFSKFVKVFFKEATDYVSPFQPYNHKINFNKTFVPKIRKIYPLSSDKKKAIKDFLKENLASKKICLSNSSQTSSFFVLKNKNRKLHPCQDYCYLNEHTIQDAYPLPLISDLIINSKMQNTSPSLTSNGDTTMSASRMDISGKQPSSSTKII